MCDCVEKMKKEMEAKGMFEFNFKDMYGKRIAIPFTYRSKNEKNGELAKKVWKGRWLPKFCPMCGAQLREDD